MRLVLLVVAVGLLSVVGAATAQSDGPADGACTTLGEQFSALTDALSGLGTSPSLGSVLGVLFALVSFVEFVTGAYVCLVSMFPVSLVVGTVGVGE